MTVRAHLDELCSFIQITVFVHNLLGVKLLLVDTFLDDGNGLTR